MLHRHITAVVALTLIGLCASCGRPFNAPLTGRTIRPLPRLQVLNTVQGPAQNRQRVVEAARSFLKSNAPVAHGLTFESDPLGFVRASFWAAGIDLFDKSVASDEAAHGMQILYISTKSRKIFHRRLPRPGDIVFFNMSGKAQPYPTQVAIVETVESDGTVRALGRFANGPKRIAMNLTSPSSEKDKDGKVLNDRLGHKQGALAAQLFTTYADPYDSIN